MTDIQKDPFLRVVSGGQTTSLQDRGRFGFQDKGVPPSGVLNQNAMKIVNKLVGNNIEEAVLEIFLSGPILEVNACLLYTSPSPRDLSTSRMPSSA